MIEERFLLAAERIKEILSENAVAEEYAAYFRRCAGFILQVKETYEWVAGDGWKEAELSDLQKRNREIYEDILPQHYPHSFANPDYAEETLKEYGQILSFIYVQLRGMIPYAYEQKKEPMVIRMELFLEVYQAFACAFEEKRERPGFKEVQQIVYWFMSDYSEAMTEETIEKQIDPSRDFARRIIMESDLSDLRYLYRFGEYITENEWKTAKHLLSLPEETIQLMADTYTEGYRMGFEATNKDISKKKTVAVRYALGFERMIRQAVSGFEKIGLKAAIYRSAPGVYKNGYFGAIPNKQYDFDHKDDAALYMDRMYINRRLEVLRAGYEARKEMAAVFGGPAVLETFGGTPFAPEVKKTACKLSEKQQKLSVEFASQSGSIVNEYIKGEERSFTIIAFPTPEVGENYEEVFDEIIRINTLDYKLYQTIQQKIIDCLDQAAYVTVEGMGVNRTKLRVALHGLKDPSRESNFENCVSDVNIPVGEVFTSPVLKGTSGVLHVSRVFLNELEYRDLQITLQDGCVTEYACTNFDSEEENKKYIKDNILFHHDTLPLGEFAIGTNTTAYVAAKRFGIGDKLPILIAEKMGPHFALGDTCYSHAEDVKVYNPDGKELIARDNEISALRGEDSSKAYFNCHTDITIPYDELGKLSAVTKEGKEFLIIENGRFVLEGCEELNRPFEQEG